MKVTLKDLKRCAEDEMATATYQAICEFETELRQPVNLHELSKHYINKKNYAWTRGSKEDLKSSEEFDEITAYILGFIDGYLHLKNEILGEEASE